MTDLLKLIVVFTNNLDGCYGGYVPGTLSLKIGVKRMFPVGKLNFQSGKTLGFLFKTNLPQKSGISTYDHQHKVGKNNFPALSALRMLYTHTQKEGIINKYFFPVYFSFSPSFPSRGA